MVVSKVSQREAALLRRQVETFYEVNRFMRSIYNLEQLLDLIMQESEAAVRAEASCIGLYDPSDDCLHIEFASGEKKSEVRHLSLPLGQGIIGQVAATRTWLRVDDAQQDPRFDPSVDKKTGFTTRCILAVPIIRRDELLGVLEVINKRSAPSFTDEDVRLLEVVANQAAIAIENARLVEKMVQSERLSAIGQLAASIVHDFKTPLTVIRGFTELLQRPNVGADELQAFTKIILEDVDRLVDMAHDLLDYSRSEIKLAMREVQLGDWLDSLSRYLQQFFAASQMALETDIAYRGTVRLDPDRMRRVLLNLAANAREAMAAGGTFAIATRRCGQSWELSLEDTGRGIPSDVRSKIFQPFFTHGKVYGTGLGLAIAHQIVYKHGGTIQVQSRVAGEEEGKPSGTIFRIRIPQV